MLSLSSNVSEGLFGTDTPNLIMNVSEGIVVSLTSTSQYLNAASKTDMVRPSTQMSIALPRIPGAGVKHVEYVAPDFDDTLEFDFGA